MILVDTALLRREREGRPIRVGLIGAGFMGRAIAYQMLTATRGMRLVAVSSRRIEAAERAYREAGAEAARADSVEGLEAAIDAGRPAITADGSLIARARGIDVVIEATGAVEFGARIAVECIEHGKHLVLMNAELDGTVGPILKVRADRAGIVLTQCDGDQPGVTVNLYRFVRGIGVRPILCGNIKGLHDPYRNPTTQQEFARRWGQNPWMVTSFADGTKVSFEQATIANATGMTVARRGMYGFDVPTGTPIAEAMNLYPLDEIAAGPGIVDYVVGAVPAPGVFVVGEMRDAFQQHYLRLYKLGDGPYYCFYTPYHLCHFEVPNTIARAALFGDAALAPIGAPRVEVVATAKVDLDVGTTLDQPGGYCTYGLAETADIARAEGLLPIGLADGARLIRAVSKDGVIHYDDVALAPDRLSAALRREQDAHFQTAEVAGAGPPSPVHHHVQS